MPPFEFRLETCKLLIELGMRTVVTMRVFLRVISGIATEGKSQRLHASHHTPACEISWPRADSPPCRCRAHSTLFSRLVAHAVTALP